MQRANVRKRKIIPIRFQIINSLFAFFASFTTAPLILSFHPFTERTVDQFNPISLTPGGVLYFGPWAGTLVHLALPYLSSIKIQFNPICSFILDLPSFSSGNWITVRDFQSKSITHRRRKMDQILLVGPSINTLCASVRDRSYDWPFPGLPMGCINQSITSNERLLYKKREQ